MTKTRKIFTSVLACVMMLCTLFVVTPITASAAVSSYGTTATRTITVKTKANWWIPGSESITLKQTKGTCEKTTTNIITGKKSKKVSKEYGTWIIVACATDGSDTVRKTLSGSSVKINLKPNKTYKITVTWKNNIANGIQVAKGSFTQFPTWKVSSTYKVSSYY